ncbi:MAG: hypothetical protein L6V79_06800 [Clostridium sp.]|nr:MAG: hypothetical protein L6V79_06800 [Clostridium sp.]
MSKPRIEFHSRGPEGNIYFIIGKARDALRHERRINDYNDMWERVQKLRKLHGGACRNPQNGRPYRP